jgi:hypothetical protein
MFDEDVAREFYVKFLAFDVEWEHRHEEGLPLFMQIRRNACVLRLSGHHGDACPGAYISIEAENVALLADTLRGKNYKHARPGGTVLTPWGTREVTVTDPFGNRLNFFERME